MASLMESTGIVGTLLIDEIPVKLRCAACDKLAVNAFRMPCCEQSICEDCQGSLPQACPVCLHEPVSKDDCRPNKALRTTIKVFLKKKGVERDGARKRELLAQAAATPSRNIEETPALHQSQSLIVPALESQSVSTDIKLEDSGASRIMRNLPVLDKDSLQLGIDVPQQSIESPGSPDTPRRNSSQTLGDGSLTQQDTTDDTRKAVTQDEVKSETSRLAQDNVPNTRDIGFGFDVNGGFPNMTQMGMGAFNPMMQFMPNGMSNNMLGQFPNMMGLPGMGLDSTTMSQGMLGSFGGPGMGMNGMSMGVGFDAGHNAYGGFGGQTQAFNQSQYNGHFNGMGGGFRANPGFGGNNMPQHQANFNQMHQHQNFNHDFQHGYHNQGSYNRGRGRGRGAFLNSGRGRGYGPPAYQGRQAGNEQTFPSQLPEQTQRRGSPVYTPMQGSEMEKQPQQTVSSETSGKVNDEKMKRTDHEENEKKLESGGTEVNMGTVASPAEEDKMEMGNETTISDKVASEQHTEADTDLTVESMPRPIQSILSDEILDATVSPDHSNGPIQTPMPPPTGPTIPTGPSKSTAGVSLSITSPRGRGFGRGFIRGYPDYRPLPRGRGSVTSSDSSIQKHSIPPVESPAQSLSGSKRLGVEGAPTGPKALRQGISNVAPKLPQDIGFSIVGRARANSRLNGSIKSPSDRVPRSRSRSRSHPVSRSPSPSHRRSPIRPHKSSHHHSPRHSVSPQRKSTSKKQRDRHDSNRWGDDNDHEESQEYKRSRTRNVSSHSSPRRSTHRTHRDHEKESSRSKYRSHRSHRNRTRSPDGESRSARRRSRSPELRISGASKRAVDGIRHKEKDEDNSRSSRKRHEREGDGRDHDRKRSRRNDEDTDGQEEGHRSKYGRGEERDARKEATPRDRPEALVEPPKGPKVDQHALEREARNRERQMKEIQRRALMEGISSGSRGKTNGRIGGRRASYKYEDEDLTSRVEKERESHRWE